MTSFSTTLTQSFDFPDVKQQDHLQMSPFKTSEESHFPRDVRRNNEVQKKLLGAFESISDPPRCEYRVVYVNSATQISKTLYEFKAVVEKRKLNSCVKCICECSWCPVRKVRTTVETYHIRYIEDEGGVRAPEIFVETIN
ncbi:hypothetical protein EmuJ_000835300 [Echinococcus multilocularis]|uniref:Uncharacterized protein n=1 Tax=Echinococcus multilocularis TaxID=6211 RepID=A0A068YEH6_ECHMU|nr:hypothetical protein EmuJ_000835300 [Echinococcus multilocularis]